MTAVARDDGHRFSKPVRGEIELIAGHGIEGDAHAGATVRRRSRFRGTWTETNVRQVHLLQRELFDELSVEGHEVAPGELGENVTTEGVDLLGLPSARGFGSATPPRSSSRGYAIPACRSSGSRPAS